MLEVILPDGKWILGFTVWEMVALELSLRSWSWSGVTEQVGSECLFTKVKSTKQWVEPESTNAGTTGIL